MECNKDEAIRAKQMAENKLTEMNLAGAEKFGMKAKYLYPNLDGLRQFFDTLNVYKSYAKKVNGEIDWYGVLGVEPLADELTIRKSYRKLLLLLHPDKNNSAGADGAFQIVKQAWTFLSDQSKRIPYDEMRNIRGKSGKGQPKKPSPQASQNGFCKSTEAKQSKPRDSNGGPRAKPACPSSSPSKSSTFWTKCSACSMNFEYSRHYFKHNLLCNNCRQPFIAVEIPFPVMKGGDSATPFTSAKQPKGFTPHTANSSSYAPGGEPEKQPKSFTPHPVNSSSYATEREPAKQPKSFTSHSANSSSYAPGREPGEQPKSFTTYPMNSSSFAPGREPGQQPTSFTMPPLNTSSYASGREPEKQPTSFTMPPVNTSSYAPRREPASSANLGYAEFGRSASLSSFRNLFFQSDFESASGGSAPTPGSSLPSFYEKLMRNPEDTQPAATEKETLKRKSYDSTTRSSGFAEWSSDSLFWHKKSKLVDEHRLNHNRMETSNQTERGFAGFAGLGGFAGFGMGSFSLFQDGNLETGRVTIGKIRAGMTRELSTVETQNLLMHKAKKEIEKGFNKISSADVPKTSDETNNSVQEIKEKEKGAASGQQCDADNGGKFVDTKNEADTKNSSASNLGVNADSKSSDPTLMVVQDPDFYDFDMDRTKESFHDSDVWAVYDDSDGMPRFYAMIHRVLSVKPFKLQISWLNSKSNDELAPLDWIASGFTKTCGEFWVGKHEVYKQLNSFSHKVKCTQGARGSIIIFPKKGDVWALYRNWSADWDAYTDYEVIHNYDMVEVLEDYNGESVTIALLVKVSGFKTVFRKHSDPSEVRKIPKEEMFRFSHLVPCNLLTGQEGPNAPSGCVELDPASLSVELLQVAADMNLEEMADTEVQANEEELVTKTSITSKGKEVVEENETSVADEMKIEKGKEHKVIKVYSRRNKMK